MGAAYLLAKEALSLREELVLLEEIPHCIHGAIYVERCTLTDY
jgi:hypothetical protein